MFFKKMHHRKSLMSFLNVLSGSIFLGFGFLHILPDAVEEFSPFEEAVKHFPVPYALCLLGFLLCVLIERKLIIHLEGRSKKEVDLPVIKEDAEHDHSHDHGAFHSHDVPVDEKKPWVTVLLAGGLAFHSIFEGLAIGLQTSPVGMFFFEKY
jgi:zinc transporter ZupT